MSIARFLSASLSRCVIFASALVVAGTLHASPLAPVGKEPPSPAFSTNYMDRSVKPAADFYSFANGQWTRDNPVPPDKARWASFSQLAERNSFLIHALLEDAASSHARKGTPAREAGDFYASAMDTNRLEKLGFKPLQSDLRQIAEIKTPSDLFRVLAHLHDEGVGGLFALGAGPDAKQSSIYALNLDQGGLSLPDRDYYLKEGFAPQLKAYQLHVAKMFTLLGENAALATADAKVVADIETDLARPSRSRVDLRDPNKNYNRFTRADLAAKFSSLPFSEYLVARKIDKASYVIVGQPEFFTALDQLFYSRPMDQWRIYLRWHLLHANAPFLNREADLENFNFFGKELSGQPEQEPRWKRAFRTLDGSIGEAVGELYVKKYFTPDARQRMEELVNNLQVVFRDHLDKADWMTAPTRDKALLKFDRFTKKIGAPTKFRDYSSIKISRRDYLGNVRRSIQFEERRELKRVGKPVDRTEWDMTPPTVNAYFNPLQNEIVFPAGILQPPFFDVSKDDAVNYGGIGVVIGHEITHGYDDQGRKYDAEGNLNEWWTKADAKEFDARAQKVVDEYNAFSLLPGLHVNGRLTLGENLADLGGVNIAYDALERDLARHPEKRRLIDGFTPEQRFFISFAQVWRTNIRDAEARRLATVDPHAPGRFRAVGPLQNFPPFFAAFDIKPGDSMWRDADLRAHIW